MLLFSTGVLSLLFTSSPPQSKKERCDISGKGPECSTTEGALPNSIVPFEHLQNDKAHVHERTHRKQAHCPSEEAPKNLSSTLLFNLILAGSVLPFVACCLE